MAEASNDHLTILSTCLFITASFTVGHVVGHVAAPVRVFSIG